MDTHALLAAEWQTLQTQHEQYERGALAIKLSCLAVAVVALAAKLPGLLACGVIALFWVQEGVFKTFQARLGERLLRVEALLSQAGATPGQAMQLHSEWLAGRPGGFALIGEYLASTVRPTVAFPYVPMLLVAAVAPRLA
jgi:hypothetical protein